MNAVFVCHKDIRKETNCVSIIKFKYFSEYSVLKVCNTAVAIYIVRKIGFLL